MVHACADYVKFVTNQQTEAQPMSIGHNNPPETELSLEETVSLVCRLIEVAAILFWAVHVLLTATW